MKLNFHILTIFTSMVASQQIIALEQIAELTYNQNQETFDDEVFIRNAFVCAKRAKLHGEEIESKNKLFRIIASNNHAIKAVIARMNDELYNLHAWLSPTWGCLPDPNSEFDDMFRLIVAKTMFDNLDTLNLESYDFEQYAQPDNSDIINWTSQVIYPAFHREYIAPIPHLPLPPCCTIPSSCTLL